MYSTRGLGQLSTLIQAITTQEGTCPSPSSCKNNNPGNLMYAGQPGATSGPGGFAVFDTYQDGYNALVNQLGLYANGTCQACGGVPQTIASVFQIYAPAGQGSNNPTVYSNNVAAALGLPTSTPLSSVLDGSAGTSTLGVPDLSSTFSTPVDIDLSSLGLPDFSIDPTWLIAGVMIVGFVAVMAFRK